MGTNLNKYWMIVGVITFIVMIIFAFLSKELETFVYEDVASANSFYEMEDEIDKDSSETESVEEE